MTKNRGVTEKLFHTVRDCLHWRLPDDVIYPISLPCAGSACGPTWGIVCLRPSAYERRFNKLCADQELDEFKETMLNDAPPCRRIIRYEEG